MRCLSWFMLAVLCLLAPAPAAALTADEKTCYNGAVHTPAEGRKAAAACTRLLQLRTLPGNDRFAAHFFRGHAYLVSGEPELSLADTERVLALIASLKLKDPDGVYFDLHNLRGRAYEALADRRAADDDRKGAEEFRLLAIKDFDGAIGRKVAPQAYINRGRSWAGLRDYEKAIGDFEKALGFDPRKLPAISRVVAYSNRGGAYLQKGDFERAIADLKRAIELRSNFADAYFNRGTAHHQRLDYPSAIRDYTAALRYGPKDILTYMGRARALRDLGRLPEAEADFKAALALPADDKRSKRLQEAVRELLRDLKETQLLKKTERLKEAERKEREAGLPPPAKQVPPAPAVKKQAGVPPPPKQRPTPPVKPPPPDREREAALPPPAKQVPSPAPSAEKQAGLPPPLKQAPTPVAKPPPPVPVQKDPQLAGGPQRGQHCSADAAAGGSPPQADRFALVIGISAYQKLGELPNPRNDADAMAKELKALGFTVFLGINCTHAQMAEMLERFAHAAKNAATALFFFAGHGLQHEGVNYLAPIDPAGWTDLARFVALQSVMARLDGGPRRARIMFIDACRDKPSNLPKGLAEVGQQKVPRGMFIGLAALADQPAEDGVRGNSPFTSALLRFLRTPDLELSHLFKRVSVEVEADTNGEQTPQATSTLNELFYFKQNG